MDHINHSPHFLGQELEIRLPLLDILFKACLEFEEFGDYWANL